MRALNNEYSFPLETQVVAFGKIHGPSSRLGILPQKLRDATIFRLHRATIYAAAQAGLW